MAYRFGTHAIADAQWLAVTEGIVNGARWLDQVLQHFPSPQAILHCSQAATSQYRLSSLQSAIAAASTKQSAAMLQSSGCLHLVIPSDLEYPPLLAECEDRPPFLFVLGDLTAISASSLSMVGTRKPSLDGKRATGAFAAEAVRLGKVVVSGLALGVDGAAHEAALAVGGRTVAVLPAGIDRIYPARHQDLSERIAGSGALVSEFPLGTPPRKHHFHRRNRTLSGLSSATLVIEAGRPSGTLITASAAADQGRDVMTLPWSIYHPQGAGCRFLLEDGAILLPSVAALQEHITATSVGAPIDQRPLSASPGLDLSLLDAREREVLALMGRGSVTPELLQAHLGWDLDQSLSCLSSLEIAGWVSRGASGYSANY